MNDTFNLTRFGLLLKKSVLERAMQIIGLMVFVLCFTLMAYSIFLYIGGWGMAQNLSFIWGFVGGGTFMASIVFSYFNTNAGGSAYLTFPASALEKWLCGVLITGVFFCLIFFSFYRLIDYCFVTAYHNGLDRSSPLYQRMYNSVNLFSFEGNIVRQSTILFVNFAGAMLVGSLYFNKVAIVKVALVVCGVIAVVYFLNLAVAGILFNNIDIAFPYYTVLIKVGSEVGNVELPPRAGAVADAFLQYILPATLWITAYIRLREKEI
ncbi:hypothetical protein [Mucilaginibacter psychrotolerans]|uniref:Uncharacterized protein n=1 Tax=Mucilaginibacter psychrotolerans TaxID=1524096 RepID=A0A4Y8SQS1_9SPHI|nr:hypothetical protein [Mucilaginibacter psychrotolerans]TFF40847.1 hypothetical protein E2R66_01325 [Mucilaginibacter psychrotolerans]